MKRLLMIITLLAMVFAAKAQVEPLLLSKTDDHCEQWVDSVFEKLTVKEKIGQLFVFTIAPVENKPNLALLRDVVKEYKVGGLLFSGGQMEIQAKLTNQAQQLADVPLMITFDGEWGLAMRLKGTPNYPRNMILGCIEDNQLLYEYGREVARQCRELGVHVNFAPVADVNINPKNPVINTRSFGENPQRVADKVVAYSTGLESGGVLSVSKHFPGHGDTETDSHHSLPFLSFSRARLDSIELYPFKQAISAGLGSIMVGHLEVPVLEPQRGLPSSLSRNVVQGLLIDELGFKGLVFTDALAMKGVATHTNVSLKALQAGNDMVLSPRQIKNELEAVYRAVKNGELSEEEINTKCRKVLTYKYALGVHKQKHIQLSGLEQRINTPEAHNLILRLKQAAVTVLKNKKNILPLHTELNEIALVHLGLSTNCATFEQALKKQVKVTTIQVAANLPIVERKRIHEQLANYKRIIVCTAERQLTPYQAFLNGFMPEQHIIYTFFTNGANMPQIGKAISAANSVVIAHNNDTGVQEHVVNLLFGKATALGRASSSIGDLFKPGDGVTITPQTEHQFIPEEFGMNEDVLNGIDSIALEGIKGKAYPGCQIVVLKDGKTMYDKCFGTFDGNAEHPVVPESIYDIASLTKTTATLLAVMKLYDKGLFNLSDKLSDHLPDFQQTDKANITIRELLFHQSGLPSSINFYLKAIDKDSYPGQLYSARRTVNHTVQIDWRTYAQPKFKFLPGLIATAQDDTHSLQITDNMWLSTSFRDSIITGIIDAKLLDKRFRYSCIGFVLLQKLVEEKSGMALDNFLAKEFYQPMGLKRTTYLPLHYFQKEEIVPSTIDRFIRKTTLQGYVHDETAAFQGGVSGNAGLFSTANEVALIYQMILNGGTLDDKRYLSEETCKLFTTSVSKISRRGLGFDRPDTKFPDRSPCCKQAPASVYGHAGFTGTIAWVDPDNKLVYIFLSNRIYPDVWVNQLSKLDIRKRIQEQIYKSILS
ncbi:beta-N-acetylglucosaminidase [Bacteroides sp. 214]|uniref:glycoside hydrolase family 3 N-terminal domain-containing protein n=1 Tax=Bacteroides sp. 214 TaxID=2302935 RepID=UPI0013D85217|nr:glycoside hydrolase family 3 N-terminal domain-containing protein [Bacteroides sp. 214]NDW13114.1 beta-N-acetylglucosaminidase [Bacteroides sp. 214]